MILSLQGCALWGSSTPADSPEVQPVQKPEARVAEGASASADSPAVAEVRTLWTELRCAKPAEAETRLTALLQKAPQDTGALALRGLARSELGKKEEAFDDLTAAVRAEPTARHYALRGLVLWRSGNEKAAQIDAHYALRTDKKEPVAHLVLGLAAHKAGDAARGCEEWRLACEGGQCMDWQEARSAGQCK